MRWTLVNDGGLPLLCYTPFLLMPLAGYTPGPVAQTYNAGMHTMLSLRMATARTAHQSWQLSARSC